MFWDIFVSLCAEKGTSPNGVARAIGVSSGSVTSWKQGRIPHNPTLLKIANYFGVSVDYLLGKEEKEKPAEIGELSEGERVWLETYHRLPPETREALVRVLGMFDQFSPDMQGPILELVRATLLGQQNGFYRSDCAIDIGTGKNKAQ